MFPFNVLKWKPWLERVERGRPDPFPIDRALQWMRLESGGNVCSVGRVDNGHVYEAGLAQTYYSAPGAVAYGTTVQQVRAKCDGTKMPTNLTDADRLFHAKLHMDTCRDHRDRTRAKLRSAGVVLSESSNDFWCFVKLTHAAPAMFGFLKGSRASTWREYRRYVEGLSYEQVRAVDTAQRSNLAARFWRRDASGNLVRTDYLTRVFRNCEHFGGSPGGFAELDLLLLLTALAIVLSRVAV